MDNIYEPEPRATPSYRHSRIVLVNQYVNAYSWEWRAVLAHNVQEHYKYFTFIVLQNFYCSNNETAFESHKKF